MNMVEAEAQSGEFLRYSPERLRDYLQWDIATWKHALYYWDAVLKNCLPGPDQDQGQGQGDALDLGARDGGLSLYLAEKGFRVVCSDLQGPTESARELHARCGYADRVTYQAINATEIPFEDEHFDVVIFKSVLGGIGTFRDYAVMQTAIREVYRVLKPGGLLLFAENQRGSYFHQKARRLFVPWGKRWYYISLREIDDLLADFSFCETKTYGFLSCIKKDFGPFVALDHLICRSSRSPQHYMAYGHAVKSPTDSSVSGGNVSGTPCQGDACQGDVSLDTL
jgi:SAM-dependent methyltransferase